LKISKIINFFLLTLYLIIVSNTSYSNNHNNNLKNIYEHLRNKQFTEAINKLKDLSEKNKPEAQLLYAKILYSGEITTQDFEMSYFWATTSKLGGLKKSSNIIGKLNDLIDDENKLKINEKIKMFLSKSALAGDKLAIVQIAKWNLELSPEPNFENAYKWYNIAVALGIKTAKIKRDEMIENIEKQRLFEIQKESIKIFNKINNLGG
jgi:TPR repeat protein